ncbi:Alpha/beta hydrolase fold-3 [Piptocephalis cylindrospora]|uniref:Alpha/beta hydrolase fold-3 n=1 Tax=Piptocephalis cylindrospora TaxID=1907219 RepID=A0A4P9Y0Q3_9FUNG|nr:Alpha/beta hydrolase fold-3 [Piptocephalis cylindrospora]|eukprot:RKP12376.1 Alpha/beta hydrolase fold-3 [Piptocephalis cylindrospora]
MWVDYREGCNGVPRTTATPTILYIHGGFHVACTTLTYRGLLCKLSRQSDCPIFAPRYRKAPENPFPLALEDILAAFMQLLEDPQVDPNNIIIAGDSSGAGMAVALRMILKDAGLPGPAGMLLWYPYLDMTLSLPSVKGNGRWDSNIDYADFLPNDSTRDLALYTGDHYYVRDKALLSHPYVSPLMADSFGDMGPTLVVSGIEVREAPRERVT